MVEVGRDEGDGGTWMRSAHTRRRIFHTRKMALNVRCSDSLVVGVFGYILLRVKTSVFEDIQWVKFMICFVYWG